MRRGSETSNDVMLAFRTDGGPVRRQEGHLASHPVDMAWRNALQRRPCLHFRWVSNGRRHRRRNGQGQSDLELRAATANVCTLIPIEARDVAAGGHGSLASSKCHRLERALHENAYDLIGVQETRIQGNVDVNREHYRVVGSSATDSGLYGVQLWIAVSLHAEVCECRPVDPRELFVVLRIGQRMVIVGVGHSPIEGSDDTEVFYESFGSHLRELRTKHPDAFVWILADLNTRVGSVPDLHIGRHGAQTENSNGCCMRRFLVEHQLAAVNAFFEHGAGWTWAVSTGQRHRIDYVLCLRHRLHLVKDCVVDYDIDLVDSERDDHCLVVALATLPSEMASEAVPAPTDLATMSRQRRLCPEKLKDPELRAAFEHWVSGFVANAEDSIDDHLASVQDHILRGAIAFQSVERKPNKSWISSSSWSCMQQRTLSKRKMRASLAAVRIAEMRLMFLAWAA